jgi:hypothetical protein
LLDLLAQVRSTNKADNALLAELDEGFFHLLGDELKWHMNDQVVQKRQV